MKIITEPSVEVVAHTVFTGHSRYKIPPAENDALAVSTFATKGCYDSYGEDGRSCEQNQERIIESRHGSVLEHFHISLFIEGITRGLSLEMNRHRHFAISQRSTRYTAEEDCAIVLEPYYASLYLKYRERPSIVVDSTDNEFLIIDRHLHQCERSIHQYQEEVDRLMEANPLELKGTDLRKWARGKARNILPHALETRGTWSANIRTWRHFLEMRTERYAEEEIRRLAGHVYDALQPVISFYLKDYDYVDVLGHRELQTKYRKV